MVLKASLLTVLALLASTPAYAQSATGSGSITVVRPLAVAKTQDLQFGAVIRPSAGSGSVTISPAGAASFSGSGVAGVASGDAPQAAAFTVTGEGGQIVSITVPATFDITNGSETLVVTTSTSLTGPATLGNVMGASGALEIQVGGSVPLSSTSGSGRYTGTFTVSAAYN